MMMDAERKKQIVEQAKGLLIENRHMTEPEAHRYLQLQAMNQRIPKLVIAQGIIRSYAFRTS
ncbi:MAG: ANTAR domain-containing protein [Oscillospiraceae bacterium]|jgi:response regulator NasT|nr:ANTAR domain-containing protein [Oscillospiraceae bacterium]